MRVLLAVAVIGLMLGIPGVSFAEDMKIYPIASGLFGPRTVVELDVPQALDGVPFYLIWQTSGGQGAVQMTARAGRHSYEMRHRSHWDWSVQAVAVTLPGVSGRAKRPSLSDEIDMLLQPDVFSPAAVNFLDDRRPLGWPVTIFLVAFALLAALGFSRLKKSSLTQSLVVGFLAAWGLAAVHDIYNHIAIVRTMEARHEAGMFPLADLSDFADRASALIGRETWSDDLGGFFRSYIHYRLAEHPYIALNPERAAFRITQKQGAGPIVWAHAGYYLVKNTPH